MLNVTSCSRACIQFDRFADYVPVLSSITNLVDLILQDVSRSSCLNETNVKSNHYLAYLQTKDDYRCIFLTIPICFTLLSVFSYVFLVIPVLASISIAAWDIRNYLQAEREVSLAKACAPTNQRAALELYGNAADRGSTEAMYQLGLRFLYGVQIATPHGMERIDPVQEDAIRCLRSAAALGHQKALDTLHCEASS